MASTFGCSRAWLLNMLQRAACGVFAAMRTMFVMLSPLLSTLPAVRVAAAAGRGHRVAHLGWHGGITAHAGTLERACFMHALVHALAAMIFRLPAAVCQGHVWPHRRHPRRACFFRDAWARIRAESLASPTFLKHASLLLERPPCYGTRLVRRGV
jgi:hypothetical protein